MTLKRNFPQTAENLTAITTGFTAGAYWLGGMAVTLALLVVQFGVELALLAWRKM